MTVTFNPFDPSEVDDQLETLAELRHGCPVAEVVPGVFYLARHEDIIDICRAPGTFKQGRFLPLDQDTRTPDQLNLGETDPPDSPFLGARIDEGQIANVGRAR